MATEWKIGDKVQLASGGPVMTVTHVGTKYGTNTPYAQCDWFDDSNKAQTKDFHPDALVSAPKK
jgi:uncharacterized protein YodC (DUF2158 family)